jgi:hypothetical protein
MEANQHVLTYIAYIMDQAQAQIEGTTRVVKIPTAAFNQVPAEWRDLLREEVA